eukprot:SAG11_NODE_2392_length_3410_cov_20.904259_2_plen_166_part_00
MFLKITVELFEVDSLSVANAQDVRIFSSAIGSTLTCTGMLRVMHGGMLTVTGSVSVLAFRDGLTVETEASLGISGAVALSMCDLILAFYAGAVLGAGVVVAPADGDGTILTEARLGTLTAALSELASRVGEEMIVKRVYSVYGQYTQKTQIFVPKFGKEGICGSC